MDQKDLIINETNMAEAIKAMPGRVETAYAAVVKARDEYRKAKNGTHYLYAKLFEEAKTMVSNGKRVTDKAADMQVITSSKYQMAVKVELRKRLEQETAEKDLESIKQMRESIRDLFQLWKYNYYDPTFDADMEGKQITGGNKS